MSFCIILYYIDFSMLFFCVCVEIYIKTIYAILYMSSSTKYIILSKDNRDAVQNNDKNQIYFIIYISIDLFIFLVPPAGIEPTF